MIPLLMTAALLMATLPATADTLPLGGTPGGSLPVRRDFATPLVLAPGHELVVRGSNPGPNTAVLVIRLDDGRSTDYASRLNEERRLPPGPFIVRLPTEGLRASSGRRLDTADIHRLIVFTGDGAPAVTVDGVAVEPGFRLPSGALGLDFGPPGGAVFPGFEAVVPGDPRIIAGHPIAIARPGGDALIADGLRGVERVAVPLANGRWHVTAWTEDLGEWETLPHPLERRIRFNGTTVLEEHLTPAAWIAGRYLAGRAVEALPGRDAWDVLGSRRGGRVTAEVDVTGGVLTVDLAGDSPAATFLSGLLIEPPGADALPVVEAARALRFRDHWREAPAIPAPPVSALLFGLAPDGPIRPATRPAGETVVQALAPGTGGRIDLLAVSPTGESTPRFMVHPPTGPGGILPVRAWAGQWRFERAETAGTLLVRTADHLLADVESLPLSPQVARRYVLRIDIPEGTPAGRYDGAVRLDAGGERRSVPLTIDVLPIALPAADRPIGFYLDASPEFDWFSSLAHRRREAVACDLRTLRSFGLTGVAPPLTTPTADGLGAFIADVAAAEAAGFQTPFLAYAPFKRLIQAEGVEGGVASSVRADDALAAHGLSAVAWSLVDEPGNADSAERTFADQSRILRSASPSARRAAHFNHPADRRWLGLFDLVLVNPGFGIDAGDLDHVRAAGAVPWLYNTGAPRLTAGFYLWRSGAAGYLQWHARMPTADPFDPTDGREGDVQVILLGAEPCPPQADIHATLLDMAEGVDDLRWLLWLERQDSPAARTLLRTLRGAVPDRWAAAKGLSDTDLRNLRRRIVDLARPVN